MNTKIALITGGSRGLGKNAALKLAEKGVDSIITWRSNREEAQAVVDEIIAAGAKAAALPLDVAKSHTFAQFAREVGEVLGSVWQRTRFDYLVNNAGTALHADFIDTTEAQFDEMVNIHFKGSFFLTQTLLPLLNDGGRILNISSGTARFSLRVQAPMRR